MKRDVSGWWSEGVKRCPELDPLVMRVTWSKNEGEYNNEGNTIKVKL